MFALKSNEQFLCAREMTNVYVDCWEKLSIDFNTSSGNYCKAVNSEGQDLSIDLSEDVLSSLYDAIDND